MRQLVAVAIVLCLVAAVTSQNPQGGFAPAVGHAFLDSEDVAFHHDSTNEDDKVREKRQFGFGGGYGGGRGGGYGGRGGFGGGRGFGGGGYGGRGGFGGGGFGGGGGGYGR